MATTTVVTRPLIHPLHGILLAFPIALFTTALLADIAYLQTAEIQWTNFAAWAITGAMVASALVVLWAIIALFGRRNTGTFRSRLIYLVVVLVMSALGLVNAFQHSRDAWSSVGTLGLTLSILSTLCAVIAGWIAFSARPAVVGVAR